MTIKYLRIGSMKDAFGYDDAVYPEAGEFPDPIKVTAAPTNIDHVLRLGDLGGMTVAAVSVANIDDPSTELNAIEGNAATLLLVYEADPGPNQVTIYGWDSAVAAGESVPFVVDGLSGYWFAIGGKYTYQPLYLLNHIILDKASGKGIKVDTASPSFGYRDLLGEVRVQSPGANDPTWATFRGNVKGWSFSNAVMTEVFVNFHIPHDYVPGTDIYLHFHWAQNVVDTGGAAAAPGDVKWQADVSYAKSHDQAAYSAPFTTSVVQTASGTQYQHMLAEVQLSAASPSATQIDSDDLEADGVIKIRAFRDPADAADTLDQVPFLDYVDIHYQSTNLATKAKAPDFWT